MTKVLITNNPIVLERFSKDIRVEFFDVDYLQILKITRDMIHKGYKLLTHPLSSSVKPNETPYKTVMLSHGEGNLDMDSLLIIEGSINTALKFLKDRKTPSWDDNTLNDFQVIDLSLIEPLVKRI